MIDLEVIWRRAVDSTDGKWELDVDEWGDAYISVADHYDICFPDSSPQQDKDAEFIAHAREDVLDLLGEIKKLRRDNPQPAELEE